MTIWVGPLAMSWDVVMTGKKGRKGDGTWETGEKYGVGRGKERDGRTKTLRDIGGERERE